MLKKLTELEITEKIKMLSYWTYQNNAIHANFKFNNFKDTFFVMKQIAFIAEKIKHHPNWSNVYNVLNISLTTHDVGGVTEKDFKLAVKINAIVEAVLTNHNSAIK